MKIKAGDMKPGMVIAIKRNKTFDDVCLVLARTGGKSDMDIEYTHLDLQDSYGGALVGKINGNTLIKVYKGKKRKYVMAKIKEDLFSWRDRKSVV